MQQEKIYNLRDVTARLGNATEAEVRVELEGYDNNRLIAKGRRVATPRASKELGRNYGVFADWLPTASTAQIELLGYINNDWLRIASWTGRQAEIHHEANEKGESLGNAEKDARTAQAGDLVGKARRARNRLYTSLTQLAAGIATWEARIEAAYATSTSDYPVCDSLLALCDVADAMLKDTSPGLVARLKRNVLKSTLVQQYRDLGNTALAAAKDAAAIAPAAPVTQGEVDLWDGMALVLFEQFVHAVEEAHEEDPTIPAPSIIGLRSYFKRTGGKKAGDEGEGGDDGSAPSS